MNVYIKTKVLFKFGSLERLYVEMRSIMLFKIAINLKTDTQFRRTCMYMLSHM